VIDYSANRWRESWNSIPQYGGGGSILDHGSFGGGSFTLGQTLAQSDPLKYRPGYFDRGKGEWVYFDELTRQYYYNKSSPYWGTGFVQVKADMGEYVRWVRDFGVQSTRIYLDASNEGDKVSLLRIMADYTIMFPYDFYGAGYDFAKNYRDMRKLNLKNSDKYFHSKANFQATKRGPGGAFFAIHFSNLREIFDQRFKGDTYYEAMQDQEANTYGRMQGWEYRYFKGDILFEEAIPKYRKDYFPARY